MRIVGLFWAAATILQGQAPPPMFTVTDLGILPGKAVSQATAISSNGTVVGYSSTAGYSFGFPTGAAQSWIWANGVQTAMPVDGPTIPLGINGSGQIVGMTSPTVSGYTFLNDSLTVNNKQVALFAVDSVSGQQQINFQVPWEVASGPNATIAVSNGDTAGASISVAVLTARPGIFNYSAGGNAFGAILHADFQLADTTHPAKPGETLLVYCTGLGAVSSPPADGEPGSGQMTTADPTVTVGGRKATVSFSGLAPGFVGLYQISVEVPAALTAGNQPVVVESGGTLSNSVLLPVE